uniref:(northern house mosquito) hypothetical protein n=1 Tax=Culex pipiens TaxID=7175 RepID=A0A8D8DM73_CULPI
MWPLRSEGTTKSGRPKKRPPLRKLSESPPRNERLPALSGFRACSSRIWSPDSTTTSMPTSALGIRATIFANTRATIGYRQRRATKHRWSGRRPSSARIH